jgi:Trypsin-like peptidase domain
MNVRHLIAGLLVLISSSAAFAQVPPPKRESRMHHIFAAHHDMEDLLPDRFEALKCALVLIRMGNRLGTGFYISPGGDIATASHVLGDRAYGINPDGTVQVNIMMADSGGTILDSANRESRFDVSMLEVNADAWLADVARIKTGMKTSCWLSEADDRVSRPGEHLITLGFPGLSFQTLTLYEGLMSARLKPNLPLKTFPNGMAILGTNDLIRVQMPISAGQSGAPIIDDENRAVGIVTTAGLWTEDLDHLLLAARAGVFNTPPPPPVPGQPQNSMSFTLNAMGVTAELAGLVHDYASPGYGDAVPLRYLRKPPQQNPPSSSQPH